MSKSFIAISLIFSVLTISNASAICKVAIGGPGANSNPVQNLSISLQKMFDRNKKFRMDVYPVSTLSEAVATEADYLVLLKGSPGIVNVQFRDLLINKILTEKTYSSAGGVAVAINNINKDVERDIIPLLPKYCK